MPKIIDFDDDRKYQWRFSKKFGLAGSCGVFTYDIQQREDQDVKKISIMWITSPAHDTDVNWFAL